MKKAFILIGLTCWSNVLLSRVYICKESNPEHCERIDQVLINGEWVEANCENFDVPDGWYIDCCC